jgi:hypothetical protein
MIYKPFDIVFMKAIIGVRAGIVVEIYDSLCVVFWNGRICISPIFDVNILYVFRNNCFDGGIDSSYDIFDTHAHIVESFCQGEKSKYNKFCKSHKGDGSSLFVLLSFLDFFSFPENIHIGIDTKALIRGLCKVGFEKVET